MMKKTLRTIIQFTVLATGITLLILGILSGELQLIFQKGTIVCLECIGIG